MQQTWTLHVKGFGKIREAAITVKPMLLFIGKNNTGKSYLSMLLWGLLAHGQSLFPKTPPDTPAYRACVRWLEDFIAQQREELTTEDCQVFIGWFNELLDKGKNEFVKQIFTTDTLFTESMSIENYEIISPLNVIFTRQSHEVLLIKIKGCVSFNYRIEDKELYLKYTAIQNLLWKLLLMGINFPLPKSGFPGLSDPFTPIFLPASRTGFMLDYKALAEKGFSQFGYDPNPKPSYTLPIIDFLKRLISLSSTDKSLHSDIASQLETHITQGIIEVSDGMLPEFSYIPADTHEKLPMHLSSSLVTELAPLILFVRSYDLDQRVLIIEEPEAHLHLEAQRYLARALVRLVNRGVPIWLTTHGDTLFQQINNLIYLYKLRHRGIALEKMDYTAEELLAPENVAAYEFETENGATVVKELALTYGGFPTPTFSRTIADLSQEIYDLQEADDDDEN